MVEFALSVPVLLLLLFGVIEGSLLLFGIITVRFADGEAAKTIAEYANNPSADGAALTSIQKSPAGSLGVVTIEEIDIVKEVVQSNGDLVPSSTSVNVYGPDYKPVGGINYPPSSRSTRASALDYVGVTIKYRYSWKDGLFGSFLPPVDQSATYVTALEPSTF